MLLVCADANLKFDKILELIGSLVTLYLLRCYTRSVIISNKIHETMEIFSCVKILM